MSERQRPSPEKREASQETDVWGGSNVEAKIAQQLARGVARPQVLITDRDGTQSVWDYTFTGPKSELAEYAADTQRLNRYITERGIVMIMNTGGSLGMMTQGLRDGTIPADAALVAGGTELYIVKNNEYVLHEGYRDYLENEVGYKRSEVYPVCQQFMRDIVPLLGEASLEFQPRDSQENVEAWANYQAQNKPELRPTNIEAPQPFKITLNYSGSAKTLAWTLQQLQEHLTAAGLPKIKVVHSANTYAEGKYFIDLLATDKQEAADTVIRLLHEEYGPITAAVAGDAENDVGVILHSGQAGIAVGNRQQALEDAINVPEASRVTKHFRIIQGENGPRLIYKDPDPKRKAAASLLHAVRALELADRLIKK